MTQQAPLITQTEFNEMKTSADTKLFPVMGVLLGVPADFSAESLSALEAGINRMYPAGAKSASFALVSAFGMYLGETLVRTIPGASWVKIEGGIDIRDISVEVPINGKSMNEQKIMLKPFSRIVNFWHDRTDGIRVLYDTASAMNLGVVKFGEKYEGPEWKRMGNTGGYVRMFSAENMEEGKRKIREAQKTHPFNPEEHE
ncbi:hypothetical protein [Paenibacillus xylanexedens]|uniref:hypothetical protein n=1 Tax=Paenibacillus xylanexedens TaxID=528191 RepID=UPI0011A0BD3F|nr:hypothetical protein [Paenibacillus xylanexedens]